MHSLGPKKDGKSLISLGSKLLGSGNVSNDALIPSFLQRASVKLNIVISQISSSSEKCYRCIYTNSLGLFLKALQIAPVT